MGRSKELPSGAENEAVRQGVELMLQNIDSIGGLFDLRYPDEFIEFAADKVASGSLIVLAGNHLSHADVFPLVLAANALTVAINRKIETGRYYRQEYFEGFDVPMAASVATGGQGELISDFYDQINDWSGDHNVRFVPINRGKYSSVDDGMGTARELLKLRKRIEGNTGLAIFPEGTVQGGRCLSGSDERCGIVPVAGSTIMSDLVLNSKQEREIVFVPIGNSRSYDVFDPNTKMPTTAAIEVISQNLFSESPTYLATASMGEPFKKSDLCLQEFEARRAPVKAHQAVNYQVLQRISQLLPYEERGVFKLT